MVVEIATIVFGVLLVVTLLVCWIVAMLGLPGNWIMIAAVALFAYFAPDESRLDIDWPIVVTLLVLALFGEGLELLAGSLGAAKQGGSKRGAVLALLGSITGAIVGALIGSPIPFFIGSLVCALLFAGLGALGGAMLGERWKGKDLEESWKVGKAAFWGRLLGTLGKVMVGGVMIGVTVAALIVR